MNVWPTDPVDKDDPDRWHWTGPASARTSADTAEPVAALLGKLEQTGQDQLILRLVAGSSACFRAFVLFADALVNRSVLPAADREALVLRLAVVLGLPYEWHSHLGPAADAGLTSTQIAALGAERLDRSVLSPSQALAVDLGIGLVEGRRWSDGEWRAAVDTWGAEGALDLLLAVGWWGGLVSLLLDALELVPAGAPPT